MSRNYFSFRLSRARHHLTRSLHVIRMWFANYLNRHIYGAWRKLGEMRWQFAAWVLIIVISFTGIWHNLFELNKMWLKTVPTSGGSYREGIIGRVHLVNPLYADNSATTDVTELVYSKLVRVKSDESVSLDLATKWEVTPDKRTYTFHLRPDARWQDGVPLTAKDVVFTLHTIQNPDSRSILTASWDKVSVNLIDDQTVEFGLPASYSGFMNALGRVGILPEHVLSSVNPSILRLDEYNQQPIGSGPFVMDRLDPQSPSVTLRRNDEYYGKKAYLDKLELRQFDDSKAMLESYSKREIDGLAGIQPEQLSVISSNNQLNLTTSRLPLMVGLYFNTTRPGLNDVNLRQGLTKAIDRQAILHDIVQNNGQIVSYPIPPGYIGFNAAAPKPVFDQAQSKAIVSGKFTDRLKLVTVNSGNFPVLAAKIAKDFQEVGVPVDVITADSFTLQQNYIRPRQYDMLLYGENMAGDSDVYSFWHSSQAADPGLNVSAYTNPKSDALIEQARLGKDPNFRNAKYQEFVSVWANDVPAVLLYSPDYLYAHSVRLTGQTIEHMTSPSDRLLNAEEWAVKSHQVPKKSK